MKGKTEREEKKGKERRTKRRGGKKRGKITYQEKKERKNSSTAGLEPMTFLSTANCLQLLPEVELDTQMY